MHFTAKLIAIDGSFLPSMEVILVLRLQKNRLQAHFYQTGDTLTDFESKILRIGLSKSLFDRRGIVLGTLKSRSVSRGQFHQHFTRA